MDAHQIEMQGDLKPKNLNTAEATALVSSTPDTNGGGQLYYGDTGYFLYYDDNEGDWQAICTMEAYNAHVYASNPHSNSASTTSLNNHINNTNDPHETAKYLLDPSNGIAFVQEEDTFSPPSGETTNAIYFDNTYQLGSVSCGMTPVGSDDGNGMFVGWIRNVDDEITGFYYYTKCDGIETIYYSMFGVVNADMSDVTVDIQGTCACEADCGADCTCESDCGADCTCESDCGADCGSHCSSDYPGCDLIR